MTDSGAIESDLERFQKTFSRSPTYKAALSPRERRAMRHETSRVRRLRRGARTHVRAYTRTYERRRERRRCGMMRRGRRRTAWRVKEDRTRGRRRRGGGQKGKRTRVYVDVRLCVCVFAYMDVDACWCARAGTTESTERNTEKTLVKGKRPLCLPFQSNRPPLSPLSFSLCPRFGSSCSLPAKSPPPPLSFSHGLSSTGSHPLSLLLFRPLPLLYPASCSSFPLRLTCA